MHPLERLRLAKFMTQQQLADKAGVNRSTVQGIERGRQRNLRSQTIVALAGALHCKPTDIAEPNGAQEEVGVGQPG